ncbi:hypothetical protein HN51_063871 [Arachis hypogaea]
MGDENTAVLELGDGAQIRRRIEKISSGSRDRSGDKSNHSTEIERPSKYIEKTIRGMKENRHKSKEMNEEGAGQKEEKNNVQPNMVFCQTETVKNPIYQATKERIGIIRRKEFGPSESQAEKRDYMMIKE